MGLDAIVWLIVGIGVGVGGSLMLLMLYAVLERWRLGRRLRRARVLRDVPAPRETVGPPAPSGSKLALLDRKAEPRVKVAVSPVDANKAAAVVEPVAVEPKPQAAREPAPALAVVLPEPETPPIVDAAPVVVEVKPEVAAPPSAPVPPPVPKPTVVATPASPRPQQSVEDMFAEAFALEKVSVAPLTSNKDGSS